MTFSLTIGGTDVAGKMVLPEGLGELTSAADGEPNECQIIVDDPEGAMTFQALAEVIAEESAAANPRLYTGIVTQLQQSRGTYRDGPGRIWTLTITDLNERPHRRVFHAADAKRPAETGTQRLDWLLASVGLTDLVWDNGKVMANAWNYDETDYRDQYADDVLATIVDAASAGRWTAFVYWDPTAPSGQEPSLFYGEVTTTTFDSTLALSNVLSEVDNTTVFGPATDSEVTGEAAPIYDGVDVIGPFGRLYRQLASTYATFGIHRDAVYETIRNNNLTSASLHADSFLAHHAGQVDTITCTVTLPRDKVTLITAGMRLGVYFSHLDGYDDPGYTFTRVTRCTVRFTDGRNDFYDLHLELSTRGISQSGGGGNPGGFPNPPGGCDSSSNLFAGLPVAASDTAGGYFAISNPDNLTDGTGAYTSIGDAVDNPAGPSTYFAYWTMDLGAPGQITSISLEYLPGGGTYGFGSGSIGLEASSDGSSWTGLITPATFAAAAIPSGGGLISTIPIAATYRYWRVVWTIVYASGGLQFRSGVTLFELTCGGCFPVPQPPSPGQWVYGETVVTTAGVGTTAFPYASGSLIVYVDGVKISKASYTETNPAAGTFTLSWTPDADETVKVDYQGV